MQNKRRKLLGARNKTRTKTDNCHRSDLRQTFLTAPRGERESDSAWRSSAFYRDLAEREAGSF